MRRMWRSNARRVGGRTLHAVSSPGASKYRDKSQRRSLAYTLCYTSPEHLLSVNKNNSLRVKFRNVDSGRVLQRLAYDSRCAPAVSVFLFLFLL